MKQPGPITMFEPIECLERRETWTGKWVCERKCTSQFACKSREDMHRKLEEVRTIDTEGIKQ